MHDEIRRTRRKKTWEERSEELTLCVGKGLQLFLQLQENSRGLFFFEFVLVSQWKTIQDRKTPHVKRKKTQIPDLIT